MKRIWRLLIIGIELIGLSCFKIPPLSAATCDQRVGSLQRVTYDSTIQQETMIYSIYLPPCYTQTERTYPTIYLLHGLRSDDRHWLQLDLIQTLNSAIRVQHIPPMIVVMPYGGKIANVNAFGTTSWNTIFIQELMPHVEKTYRVSTNPAERAIGGISRGGFWAYTIALRYPNTFSAVGGHSAAFSVYAMPPIGNPINLLETFSQTEPIRFWLDRGLNDPGRDPMDIVAKLLDARGLPLEYKIIRNGEHDDSYWSSNLINYIEFYARDWHEQPNNVQKK